MIKFLQELIAVPSENDQQNIEMADFLARRLKEFGFDNTQELDVIESNQATQQPKKHIKNVLTIQSFGTGRTPEIVLNAYGDTVPPGIGWEYDRMMEIFTMVNYMVEVLQSQSQISLPIHLLYLL